MHYCYYYQDTYGGSGDWSESSSESEAPQFPILVFCKKMFPHTSVTFLSLSRLLTCMQCLAPSESPKQLYICTTED